MPKTDEEILEQFGFDRMPEPLRQLVPRIEPPRSPGDLTFVQVSAELEVVVGKLPEKHQEWTTKAIDEVIKDKDRKAANEYLIGNIQEEYGIPFEYIPDSFREYLNWMISYQYGRNEKFLLLPPWINYQSKYEFNPPHAHQGDFSYTIWKRIPYDVDKEKELYSKHYDPNPGSFNFLVPSPSSPTPYTQMNCSQAIFDMRKDWEEVICVFPSDLMHYVNPFRTSDEYRISIAGNLIVDNS